MGEHLLDIAVLAASLCIAVFAPIVLMIAVSSLAQYLLRLCGGKLVVGTIEGVSLSHLTVVYSPDGGTSSFRTSLPYVTRDKYSQEGQEVKLLIPRRMPKRPLIWRDPCRTLAMSVACLLVFWLLNPGTWVEIESVEVAPLQRWLFFIIAGILIVFKGSEKRSTGNATTIVSESSPTAPCIEMIELEEKEGNQQNNAEDVNGEYGNGSFETGFLVALASMR